MWPEVDKMDPTRDGSWEFVKVIIYYSTVSILIFSSIPLNLFINLQFSVYCKPQIQQFKSFDTTDCLMILESLSTAFTGIDYGPIHKGRTRGSFGICWKFWEEGVDRLDEKQKATKHVIFCNSLKSRNL